VRRAAQASSVHNTLTMMEESPCYSTEVGKAVFAFQPEATVSKAIRAGLTLLTPYTIADGAVLRRQLEEISTRGYTVDDREHESNIRCVAAPIRNASVRVFAAISVSGPVRRIDDAHIPALTSLVMEQAASISAQLGHI